jgi:hypothetical protein
MNVELTRERVEFFRNRRLLTGLTQKRFAKCVGLPLSVVRSLESYWPDWGGSFTGYAIIKAYGLTEYEYKTVKLKEWSYLHEECEKARELRKEQLYPVIYPKRTDEVDPEPINWADFPAPTVKDTDLGLWGRSPERSDVC